MRILFFLLTTLMYSTLLTAQQIKVMTYNIRLDTPVDSVNQWPNRTEKVFALIRKYDPDILGVQEAIHHQLMDLVKNLPQYGYIGVGRDDGKTKGEYSAILYKKDRFTVLQQKTFWLSETPEVAGSKSWDAAITRVVTWGKIKDLRNKSEFFVFNTHFDHIGQQARRKSAALIKQKISQIAQNNPVILTGDFNCTRLEPPYASIMEPVGTVLIDPLPGAPIGTSCGFKVHGTICKGIDYIFHTAQWKSSGYKVIEDNDGTYYPSDHLPVMTTLVLTP